MYNPDVLDPPEIQTVRRMGPGTQANHPMIALKRPVNTITPGKTALYLTKRLEIATAKKPLPKEFAKLPAKHSIS